jgi:ABC-type Fe3+ transport system permease subunit
MDNQNYQNEQQQPPQYQQPYQPNYANQPQPQRPMKPDNYLVWAILCTILCCLPLGIVSIVYAAKVDGLYNSGDYQGAQEASDNAKKWAMWGAIIGVVATIILCVIYGFMIAGAIAEGY